MAFTAEVWVNPKKYARGAITVPKNPTSKTSFRHWLLIFTGFLLSKIYAKAVIAVKNASEAVTCKKFNDDNKIFPRIASTAHIAPAAIPKRIPRAF